MKDSKSCWLEQKLSQLLHQGETALNTERLEEVYHLGMFRFWHY